MEKNKTYPTYEDFQLDGLYQLSKIIVHTPKKGYSWYTIYYSQDGVNYNQLAQKRSMASCPKEGEIYDVKDYQASSIRVVLEYNSESSEAKIQKVDIKGIRIGDCVTRAFTEPEFFENSIYNQPITKEETIKEVQGIVSRNIGAAYVDWFDFQIGEEEKYDYFKLIYENEKVKIIGNNGVSLAAGLNYYLKYYCHVCISQVGNQTKMPRKIAVIENPVYRQCKVPLRYAYNYCTFSYTMAFWGKEQWRKELDWLALNGINLVLDLTGQEEVWRQFLKAIGYDHKAIKDFLPGPAYYAWAYMGNISSVGGPVHDSWFDRRTQLARENQRIMACLGMEPVLQGYCGMVPRDILKVARGDYALDKSQVLPQGKWCAYERPSMLETTSDTYKKYAKLFYQCQKNVYGDGSHYYATDPFHEGGLTGGIHMAQVSSSVLNAMLDFDSKAVWVIQAWEGNPDKDLIKGLENLKEHALVLDLYGDKIPHWNDENYSGGYEFQNTPWVLSMINNFGGRLGLHGHMDNIVTGVAKAVNQAQYIKGIGIVPEASQNNPVLYDLFLETVWCHNADKPLEEINLDLWLKGYVNRRYGHENANAYKAMLILKETVYKAALNQKGQGAPESYVNARPSMDITAASSWGNTIVDYHKEDLEQAAALLLKEYDKLKESDAYLYDLVDLLKQVLSNVSEKYYKNMVDSVAVKDLDGFNKASNQWLMLIDKVDELLSVRKEFSLNTWIEQSRKAAEGTDDFTRNLYEFNARQLITTWGSYNQVEDGGLGDYSNRQWAGLTKDYYKPRWKKWIARQKEILQGRRNEIEDINWFCMEWSWVINHQYNPPIVSNIDLPAIGKDILENYSINC